MEMQEVTSFKRNQAVELIEAGLSCAETGRRLGVSRQRVAQIISIESIRRPDLQIQVKLMTHIRKERLNNVCKLIKQKRSRSGLTLQQLAKMSGVSVSHLSSIERCRRFPSHRILAKITESLGLNEAGLCVVGETGTIEPLEIEEHL